MDASPRLVLPAALLQQMQALHQTYAYQPRLQTLVRLLSPLLETDDHILDVGCGGGGLGAALQQANPTWRIEGAEVKPRGGEPIPVHRMQEETLPFADDSYDVVMLADVLHHTHAPVALLQECARVARRKVVVKDHLRHGWFSYLRICLLDWLANKPYGIHCPFTYWNQQEWQQMCREAGVTMTIKTNSINLYRGWVNVFFGGTLHLIFVAHAQD